MEDNDIVRIRNVGESRWQDKFNSQRFVVDPGKEVVVPYPAVKLWFGDPTAKDDSNGHRLRRREEFHRLLVKHGMTSATIEEWEEKRPKIEVYDFDGNRVITVADDPTGRGVTESVTTVEQAELLQQKIDQMTRQLRQLEVQRSTLGPEDALEEDISEDTPSRVPTSRVQVE